MDVANNQQLPRNIYAVAILDFFISNSRQHVPRALIKKRSGPARYTLSLEAMLGSPCGTSPLTAKSKDVSIASARRCVRPVNQDLGVDLAVTAW
jgi:hypothetical protein